MARPIRRNLSGRTTNLDLPTAALWRDNQPPQGGRLERMPGIELTSDHLAVLARHVAHCLALANQDERSALVESVLLVTREHDRVTGLQEITARVPLFPCDPKKKRSSQRVRFRSVLREFKSIGNLDPPTACENF